MSARLRIRGGRVYDPANGVDGVVRDVCVEDGRIVATLPPEAPELDAAGLVVMPGGVDVHSHVAGPAVNLARRLEPERRTVPTAPDTGRLYALLGYTTVFDAAVPLLGARHAHLELADTRVVDKGFYVLLGSDAFTLDAIDGGDAAAVRDVVGWAVSATRAYAVKVVNPGGGAAWKAARATPGLDEAIPGRRASPRRILTALASAVESLGLPHPMHLHCNDLGLAGNARTTLATMEALEGRRAHLAHLQFHSYGGERGARPTSRAKDVAEALGRHRNLSADVGQVMFGPATTMTADGRVGEMLHDLTGRKWVDADLELEGGCGIVPYDYKPRSAVHAAQWATGLELLLLASDPWRLVMSTDHPNGGTVLSYPRLVRLLMDRAYRDAQLAAVNPAALEGSTLKDGLAREYSLSEIAILTRAAPARLLGLERKGHLGPGADADVVLYQPQDDKEKMFAAPRHVLKGGVRVASDGQLRSDTPGRTLFCSPSYDAGIERRIDATLQAGGSVRRDDYVVHDDLLEEAAW